MEDFAELEADLKAARNRIDYPNREAIMPDELQKLDTFRGECFLFSSKLRSYHTCLRTF